MSQWQLVDVYNNEVVFLGHKQFVSSFWRNTKAQLQSYEGHIGHVNHVAVVDDIIISTSYVDRVARAWNIKTGKCIETFEGHSAEITAMAVPKWNKHLFYTGSADGEVRIWDIKNAHCVAACEEAHEGPIHSMCATRAGLVSCGDKGKVILWDNTGHDRAYLQGHEDAAVTCVAVAPDGLTVYTGGYSGKLLSCVLRKNLEGDIDMALACGNRHAGRITCIAVGDHFYACGDGHGKLSIVELASFRRARTGGVGEHVKTISAHRKYVNAIVLDEVRQRIYTGGHDMSVRCFSLDGGYEPIAVIKDKATTPIGSLKLCGNSLLCASIDVTVWEWNLDNLEEFTPYTRYSGEIQEIDAGDDDYETFLSCGFDGEPRMWRVDNTASIRTFRGHQSEVNCLRRRDDVLYSGGDDNTVIQWDVSTGKLLKVFRGHQHDVMGVCVSEDNRTVYTASMDRSVIAWDAATGIPKMVMEHPNRVTCCGVIGPYVFSGCHDNKFRMWHKGKIMATAKEHRGAINAVVTYKNRVFTGSSDHRVLCWRVEGLDDSFFDKLDCSSESSDDEAFGLTHSVSTTSLVDGDGGAVSMMREWRADTPVRCVYVVDSSVYAGCQDGTIWQFGWDADVAVRVFAFHHAPVLSLLKPNDYTLVSASTVIVKTDLPLSITFGVQSETTFSSDQGNTVTRAVGHYGGLIEMVFSTLLILFDFVQLAAFAFLFRNITWGNPVIGDTMWEIQTLGFGNALDYLQSMWGVCIISGVFFVFIFFSESVEYYAFVRSRTWILPTLFWNACRLATKLISRPLFLSIFGTLARTYDCTQRTCPKVDEAICDLHDRSSGSFYTLDDRNPLRDAVLICYEGLHGTFAVIGGFIVVIYVPLCLRLARVGNKLENLELRLNPFDWSGDHYSVERYHPFTLNGVGANYWNVANTLVKMALTGLLIYFSDTTEVWVLVFIEPILGISLIVMSMLYPPYSHPLANRIRLGLDFSVLWIYLCGVAAYFFERDSQTDCQTDSQTACQTDSQTDTDTDTYTYTALYLLLGTPLFFVLGVFVMKYRESWGSFYWKRGLACGCHSRGEERTRSVIGGNYLDFVDFSDSDSDSSEIDLFGTVQDMDPSTSGGSVSRSDVSDDDMHNRNSGNETTYDDSSLERVMSSARLNVVAAADLEEWGLPMSGLETDYDAEEGDTERYTTSYVADSVDKSGDKGNGESDDAGEGVGSSAASEEEYGIVYDEYDDDTEEGVDVW